MSFFAFVLILSSAVLHASWNLVAKRNRMSVPFYTLICSTAMLIWCHVIFWTPIDFFALPARFWVYLCCSVSFDLLYCYGLMMSYRVLEMSTAYPVMRALPILLTVAVTTAFGLGSPLSLMAKLGMVVVCFGCLLMPLTKFAEFRPAKFLNSDMLFVLFAACGTMGYTILDSQAQRIVTAEMADYSKLLRSITYYSIRSVLLTSSLWLVVMLIPSNRAQMRELFVTRNRTPLLAGVFASATYVLVLLSMNYVTNVSYVQVFRQLGLPIGMLAGVFVLKERCTLTKIVGVCLIVLGLLMTCVQSLLSS